MERTFYVSLSQWMRYWKHIICCWFIREFSENDNVYQKGKYLKIFYIFLCITCYFFIYYNVDCYGPTDLAALIINHIPIVIVARLWIICSLITLIPKIDHGDWNSCYLFDFRVLENTIKKNFSKIVSFSKYISKKKLLQWIEIV